MNRLSAVIRPWSGDWVVVLVAAAIFLGCSVSPPSLMDDVDAVQASISRTMLATGDWVTPHLDGVKYFEKPPLKYWLIAGSFVLFGVHDWAARLPLALSAILLCWLVTRFGRWAFGERAGVYSGLVLATSVGLFLFTRILIADVALTLTITLAMGAFLRAMDEDEPHPRRWGLLFFASAGAGLLLKGLIAALFPVGGAFFYLLFRRQLLLRDTGRRLMPVTGTLLAMLIAAPWHVVATLRNPPYVYLSLYSGPGNYHGFFWFYFFNEHVLRFLSRRYPHDYNTVPRLSFWLLHLVWLFPWSVYLPSLAFLDYRGETRAARTRLLALCWIGFLMVFFSFSSTQEYYSMPAYPALALLLASALVAARTTIGPIRRWGTAVLGGLAAVAAIAIIFLLVRVWNTPAPGDIANALTQQSGDAYTLALGHVGDLTIPAFAYLRTPLLLAGAAFMTGAVAIFLLRDGRRFAGIAAMMVLFFHASRLALVTFDPYLSSKPLADALLTLPKGELIADDQYYTFSSVFFYADTRAWLLNGRKNNLEYGSNAPDAPHVFISDADLVRMWPRARRYYLLVEAPQLPRVRRLVGADRLVTVRASGGKYLLTNHSFAAVFRVAGPATAALGR